MFKLYRLEVIIIILTLLSLFYAGPLIQFYRLELLGNLSRGYYTISLYFGNPPQEQELLVDTGSSLTHIGCQPCNQCNQNTSFPMFNSSFSQTYELLLYNETINPDQICNRGQNNQCQFDINYADGAIGYRGKMAKETISFLPQVDQRNNFQVYIGCDTLYYQFIPAKIQYNFNGILGLSPQRTNILFDMIGQKFAICVASNGGYFQISKQVNPPKQAKQISVQLDPYFTIKNIDSMKFGQINIKVQSQIAAYGVILDTGSLGNYIPYEKFNKVIQSFNQICKKAKHCHYQVKQYLQYQCYIFDGDIQSNLNQIFPQFIIQINGYKYVQKPNQYFHKATINKSQTRDVYCFGFRGNNHYILGVGWMINRKIYYDLQDSTVSIVDNFNCTFVPEKANTMHGLSFGNKLYKFIIKYHIELIFGCLVILVVLKTVASVFCNRKRRNYELREDHIAHTQQINNESNISVQSRTQPASQTQ